MRPLRLDDGKGDGPFVVVDFGIIITLTTYYYDHCRRGGTTETKPNTKKVSLASLKYF